MRDGRLAARALAGPQAVNRPGAVSGAGGAGGGAPGRYPGAARGDVAGRARRGSQPVGGRSRAGARRDHAQKKTPIAAERAEGVRAAWRADAADLDPADLVFLDETATNIAMTPRGARVYGAVPRNHGRNTTLIAALSVGGVGAAMALDRAADGPAFVAYVRAFLLPMLRPGQVVVLDNLAIHKAVEARALVKAAGCALLFLPPYSPDFNPIELAFAKLKEALRRDGARTRAALEVAIARALDAITPHDAHGWFAACGHPSPEAQPLC